VETISAQLPGARIVTGPDSNLWYSEYNGNQIRRFSTSGATMHAPSTHRSKARPTRSTSGVAG
jgi:streptogramin lyase